MQSSFIKLPIFILLLSACCLSGAAAKQSNVTAFVGVQVIPMDSERVIPSQTVIVRDGVITAIGESNHILVPRQAQIIYGCDQYLMPGLIDMHVHVLQSDLPLYLAHGVTTVRNMWGTLQIQDIARRINSGALSGPTIYSAGPGLDGSGSTVPGPVIIEDPALAESIVANQVNAGWDFIKVYQELKLPVYQAILQAAHRHNIRAVGHVATRVPIEEALTDGQASIEHLTGYDVALNRAGNFWGVRAWIQIDESKIPSLVARTVETGAWNCPTLTIFGLLAQRFATPAERELIMQHRRQMVRAMSEAGAKLLAGTDAGINETAPGTGLHDELAELVAAGLTPYAALRTATTDAAEFLNQTNQLGSIAVGKRADLLLLASNPLTDIHALSTIKGVMARGQWSPTPRTMSCRPPIIRRIR